MLRRGRQPGPRVCDTPLPAYAYRVAHAQSAQTARESQPVKRPWRRATELVPGRDLRRARRVDSAGGPVTTAFVDNDESKSAAPDAVVARRPGIRRGLWFLVALAALVSMLFGLRWLSFALWHFEDAEPLPATATGLAGDDRPIEERMLGGGLELAKFEYSIHGTQLNVIHRSDDPGPRPTLVMVNGGGWQVEDEDRDLWYAEGWAAHGYTVVTITHRPSDVVPFAGPTEDVLAGVDFALGWGPSGTSTPLGSRSLAVRRAGTWLPTPPTGSMRRTPTPRSEPS